MSLLVSLVQKDWSVIACDGRSVSKFPDGSVVTSSDDYQKFWMVRPWLALGATGVCGVGERVREIAEVMKPQTLAEAKRLVEQYVGAVINQSLEFAVMVLGWDELKEKFRLLQYRKEGNHVDVSEARNVLNLFGNKDATATVGPWLRDFPFCGLMPRPDSPTLDRIVGRVRQGIEIAADRFPQVVNKRVNTHILLPPDAIEADGPSNFSATVSVLSYRPTTNPLTAVDAGSSATVNISSWTNQTSSKGQINYNSGTITGLSYNTVYYIYMADPALSGGGVSYLATTSKTTALNGAGNIFVGSILTPFSGGPETFGANDGGVGAQQGYSGLILASTATPSGNGTVASATNAINGNGSQYASVICSGSGGNEELLIQGFPAYQPLGSTLVLKVRSQVAIAAPASVTLKYSVDGINFTTIYSVTTSRSLQTDTVTLPANQNCGLVQVVILTDSTGSGGGATCDVYQAWITSVG